MTTNAKILRLDDPDGIVSHLQRLDWVEVGEEVLGLSRAGEGNMNLVVRIQTDRRTVVLKQSRPWVEKYPAIPAPEDRLLMEARFYAAVASTPGVANAMPRMLAVDVPTRSALLEDLGSSADCTDLYEGGHADLDFLVGWLGELHAIEGVQPLPNRDMRALNHAHMYDLPMTGEHGLNLDDVTPGLQAVAAVFRRDRHVARRVEELGEQYLSDGAVLLHGDFYPGSWLRTAEGLRVIDPEFCFLGFAEFDLGVMQAHLMFCRQSPQEARQVTAGYPRPIDTRLVDACAGVEIMRRLLGVAQLPIVRTLEEKKELLEAARALILS